MRWQGQIALAQGIVKFWVFDNMKTSDTHERQERSTTPPESEPGEITKPTRVRPVEDEIDHEALTREIIMRFPKILEALAK